MKKPKKDFKKKQVPPKKKVGGIKKISEKVFLKR